MPSGGYRAPANPAPVSGPGALSKRTDGGPADKQAIAKLPNAKYGEQQEFGGIQQGAPIQKFEPSAPSGAAAVATPPPLDAPTSNPDQPVTAGVDVGAGAGSDVLGLFDESAMAASDVQYLLRYLPTLQSMVDNTPNANTSTLALVRWLRSQI